MKVSKQLVKRLPEGYFDPIPCPVHGNQVHPGWSSRGKCRYYLCNADFNKSHFLDGPDKDDESNWGLRNNAWECSDEYLERLEHQQKSEEEVAE